MDAETIVYTAEMSPDNLLVQLEKLVAEPTLKVTVEGGGLPGSPQSMEFHAALLIDRLTIDRLILNLKRQIADRDEKFATERAGA
jgi:hypothetical protein